nr:hypothetical protein [Thermoproteota archaeon]
EEYSLAYQHKKEVLIYLTANIKDRDPKLKQLLHRIAVRHTYKPYRNPDELLEYVRDDVEDLRNRSLVKAKSSKRVTDVNSRVREGSGENLTIPEINVSPSASSNVFDENIIDVSEKEVEPVINTIISATNPNLKQQAWKRLEKIAINKRIWKYDKVWKLLDKEILMSAPTHYFNNAVAILKWILRNSEKDTEGRANPTADRATKRYLAKYEEILGSKDSIWDSYHRTDVNQILKYVTQPEDRCKIWWEAWKKCAKGIKDTNQYIYLTQLVNSELENSEIECKDSIELELLSLIDTQEPPYLSKRARDLHDLLLG